MSYTKNRYALPYRKGALIKAVSDPRAHFAHFQHAIDFVLPEGTEILAAEAGTVVKVKVDSHEGGANPKYNDIKYLNFLILKHANGEYSQYSHLKYEGVLVKVGDKVQKGQPIAISGNTGFSTAPHLHFQVFKLTNNKVGWKTLEIVFEEEISVDRTEKPLPESLQKTIAELERVKVRL